jgi:hypothetical protein
MKKLLLIATCAASLSAYALPTYEPFTEYASQIASSTLLLSVSNASGVALNANGSITNCINLATGGYTAPSGEQWGALYFSGTINNNGNSQPPTNYHGLDIAVITNSSIFTYSTLSSLLPSGFPGLPVSGGAITNIVENPAQPQLYNGSSYVQSNYVGNSAVLKFAQDITRPTSGTKTLFISYLFNVAQIGQLGTGNEGRYLAFVASTNLNEGWTNNPPGPVTGAAYTNWSSMFNTFNGASSSGVHYASHGLLSKAAGIYYIGACDSTAGKNWSTTSLSGTYVTPLFVVGEYMLNSGATLDTNIVWVNPPTSALGGAPPPLNSATISNHVWTMGFNMSDLGGLVLSDRPGYGMSGGVGTNYIANLIIGSTWSYVTGGPEFTNQPTSVTAVPVGGSTSITGAATAAGQSVSYQWVKITNGGANTNSVTNTTGGAGGGATVTGANSATLTLTGVTAGDTGDFQLVATASGTGYKLNSSTAVLALNDPQINANPANATANYAGSVTFTATVSTLYAPLSYGWSVGATPLQNGIQSDGSYAIGATGNTGAGSSFTITLTLTNVSYHDIGNYTLIVTNNLALYNSTTPAALAVNDPIITAQPANPAVAPRGTATFTVAAAGSPTLSYQWYEGTPPGGVLLVNGNTTASGATIGISSGSGTSTLTLGGSGVQDADNGSYYCAVSGSASGQTANSAAATLIVQDPLTIVTPPMSLVERAGDHVAFAVGVTGGGPQFQWYGPPNGTSLIVGATNSALVLTNIQTSNAGTYRVTVGNAATTTQSFYPTLTVINSATMALAQTNLIVARVGDGAQTLSGATGNTLYLDQFTPSGAYVNTTQIPDEAVGSPYPTGGASSLPGSPALLVQGAGADAGYEAMLTRSGVNQEYLCFAGYCQQYPYTGGSDVTVANLNTGWRGLATVNAYGVYWLAYTNYGLYSGGNHTIRSMTTLDGTNFWTTGQASGTSGGTVKYVNSTPGEIYANGSQVPSSTGVSPAGGQVIKIVNGTLPGTTGSSSVSNLVVSDASTTGNSGAGLYWATNTPEPVAVNNVVFQLLVGTGGSTPTDFAFSPDNLTLYVAQAGVFTSTSDQSGGGIQRYDTTDLNTPYTYSYTLQPVTTGAATNGAQGLTVDFSASATWGPSVNGAILYATTTGPAGNSLVQIVDNGASSTPTVLATAGPNQALRGVRFGPAAVAPAITSAPQTNTVPVGNPAGFNVAANGSAPLFYQWYFGNTLLGGATNSTYTIASASYGSAGNYIVVVSNLTTQTASVTNVLAVTAGAPTITPSELPNYVERVGDHLAWGPAITGTQPITNYWYFGSTLIQSNVTPGANGSLALVNIQTTNQGTYTLAVSNLYGHASATGTLTVTTSPVTLSSANLVVARIGDGAQALSGVTGNTLYLDQYTPNGGYVNTMQIPDEGTGQPYLTGSSSSSSMPFGSPALLFAGSNVSPGNDAGYEAFLTRSPNGSTLTFAGYCQAYPFAGPDVSVIAGGNGGTSWRGLATVDAFGYYTLAWTNSGLYSGGNHQIHSAVDIDGTSTNFYSAGQAGSGYAIKYLNVNFQPANGANLVYIAGSFSGTRVVQIVTNGGGNLVYSDVGASPIGIYGCAGIPIAPASSALLIAETNSPMDFAASPDLNTVYIADNGAFAGSSTPAGGIQRWDANGTGQYGFPTYGYSYTLGTGTGSAVGARGLTVDFSAKSTWGLGVTGAKLYATTAEASGNRLIEIVDNGAASSATLMALAGPSQILAGVRFGPTVVAPSFGIQPQATGAFAGASVTNTVLAVGSGPLTYQWYFQAGGVGSFVPIFGATNATYIISVFGHGNAGNYYVVAKNPAGTTAQSDTVAFSLLSPPQFVSEIYLGQGNGIQLNFTGPAGYSYTLWGSPDPTLTPVQTTWSALTTATFSGGVDSYTDTIDSPPEYYVLTMPLP